MKQRPAHLLLLLLLLGVLFVLPATARVSEGGTACKCSCFGNSTIIPLRGQPCITCTRQWCIDQKLPICKGAKAPELDNDTGTGTEGDVLAVCFRRDSPRDRVIVTSFVLLVCGLMLFAAVRSKLRRAIETRGQPSDIRGWGEALLPDILQQRLLRRRPDMHTRYAPVSVGS